jgi:hypothetical protein
MPYFKPESRYIPVLFYRFASTIVFYYNKAQHMTLVI